MTKMVDARGLDCPQPVILTKQAMDSGARDITTVVNTSIARENVSKLGQSQGYEVRIADQGGEFHIHLLKTSEPCAMSAESQITMRNVAVLVKSDLFGEGDPELGKVLMKSLLFTLNEIEGISQIIFMNRGVFLTTTGSPVLDLLQVLQEKGIGILSCGTCLDFYGFRESLAVGQVTNMYTALETINQASNCITI